jgi:predicted dehydrogenase
MARIVASEGTLEWIHTENRLRVYEVRAGGWKELDGGEERVVDGYSRMSTEQMYEAEIDAFVRACHGEPVYPYSFEEDRAVLAVLAAAEKSAAEGRHVSV